MAEEKTNEQKKEELEGKQRDEVIRVISGHNDTFKKDYKFKEFDLEFEIKLKFPTLMDQTRVSSETEAEFRGLSGFMNQNFTKAVWMAKLIKYQQEKYGDDKEEIYIPKFLRNQEEIYNPTILARIADDFQEWMNSFQY